MAAIFQIKRYYYNGEYGKSTVISKHSSEEEAKKEFNKIKDEIQKYNPETKEGYKIIFEKDDSFNLQYYHPNWKDWYGACPYEERIYIKKND